MAHVFVTQTHHLRPSWPQIWPKVPNSRATLTQITRVHGCRQLQKYSNVKIGSQARIMTTGMGIIHGITSQPQHFLPSWSPILAKTSSSRADLAHMTCANGCRLLQKHSKVKIASWGKFRKPRMGIVHSLFTQTHHPVPSPPPNSARNGQFEGYSSPNHMCAWLQTAKEAFQSQNMFTKMDYKAWDGIRTWYFKPTTTFSAKLTSHFWWKTNSSRANLAQIVRTYGHRLLQKHSKVNAGS